MLVVAWQPYQLQQYVVDFSIAVVLMLFSKYFKYLLPSYVKYLLSVFFFYFFFFGSAAVASKVLRFAHAINLLPKAKK